MKKINESKTGVGSMDDGPRFMYGNRSTYRAFARKMANKLGMSIEDWLLDMSNEFENHDTSDLLDTVSYFSTGDVDSENHGTDYHPTVSSKKAYDLWVAHADRISTVANDVKIIDNLDAEDSTKEATVNINENITEIGDATATPYSYARTHELSYDDKNIKIEEYQFTTDSGLTYEVVIEVKQDTIMDIGFETIEYGEEAINDLGEMYKVMSTIVAIGKEVAESYTIKQIHFNSSKEDVNRRRKVHHGKKDRRDTATTDTDPATKRSRLYLIYLKKEFPTARIQALSDGEYVIHLTDIDESQVEEEMLIDPNPDEDSEGNKHDFLPDDEIEEHYHTVEGGYKGYISEHIDNLGIVALADIWEDQLLDEHYDILDDEIETLIEANMLDILGEKTYRDLRSDAPDFLRIRDKSRKTPGSRYTHIDEDDILHFKTPSHTHAGVTYDQQVKLLDLSKLIETESSHKKPIQIIRMALQGDIQVHCTDPSWKYWGFQYIGTRDKYATQSEPRYPKIRNPNLKGSVCKHLDNVLFILPFQNMKILKDLRGQKRL